jgi:ApbE superfamily uncharacterized protein (UPF0280 family)
MPTKGDGAMLLKSMYKPRIYRHWMRSEDLLTYRVVDKETDLQISTTIDLSKEAARIVKKYRRQLEEYISANPRLLSSLKPMQVEADAPPIVTEMARAAALTGVGPMAAVAGTVAEFVGRELKLKSADVIIENGGDIYIVSSKDRVVGIYAGVSTLSGRIGIKIKAVETPLGICTSSGTVGHSLSFGNADAAIAVSSSAALADAAATAIGNLIKGEESIPKGLAFASKIDGLKGAVIIKGDKMGVCGEMEIAR